jgi:serine/threonine protein kinase
MQDLRPPCVLLDPTLQVNNLREIQALRRLSPHPHIIKLLEVLYDQPTGRLALVFELMVRALDRQLSSSSVLDATWSLSQPTCAVWLTSSIQKEARQ